MPNSTSDACPRGIAGLGAVLGLLFLSNPVPFFILVIAKGQGAAFCNGYWQLDPAAQLAGQAPRRPPPLAACRLRAATAGYMECAAIAEKHFSQLLLRKTFLSCC